MTIFILKYWKRLLISLVILVFLIIESNSSAGDFNIFLKASEDLFLGENIYEKTYFDGYHYYYDIWFALLIHPLVNSPLFIAKFLWLSLNVFFIYRIFKICFNFLDSTSLSSKNLFILKILSFVFVLSFLKSNLHLAQLTIFTLFLCLESIEQFNKQNIFFGAILLALGITIKIMPIVLIPYLIYRGNFKAVIYTLLFLVLLLITPFVFIGWEQNTFLLSQRWNLINPTNKLHVLDTEERSFHSLSTLLATLLVKNNIDYHIMDVKRNIADISIEQLNIVINIVRLVFIGATLFILNSLPFRASKSKLQNLYELSYILIITPLIFPHQQFYAFLYILPTVIYLLYFLFNIYQKNISVSAFKKNSLIVVLIVSFLLTSSHFFLGTFNDFYDHFKTLTYGVIILSVALFFFKPYELSNKVN